MTTVLIINDTASQLLAQGTNPLPEGEKLDDYDLVLTSDEADELRAKGRFPGNAEIKHFNAEQIPVAPPINAPDDAPAEGERVGRTLIYFSQHTLLTDVPLQTVFEKVRLGQAFEIECRAGNGSEEAPFRWDPALVNASNVLFVAPFI